MWDPLNTHLPQMYKTQISGKKKRTTTLWRFGRDIKHVWSTSGISLKTAWTLGTEWMWGDKLEPALIASKINAGKPNNFGLARTAWYGRWEASNRQPHTKSHVSPQLGGKRAVVSWYINQERWTNTNAALSMAIKSLRHPLLLVPAAAWRN